MHQLCVRQLRERTALFTLILSRGRWRGHHMARNPDQGGDLGRLQPLHEAQLPALGVPLQQAAQSRHRELLQLLGVSLPPFVSGLLDSGLGRHLVTPAGIPRPHSPSPFML